MGNLYRVILDGDIEEGWGVVTRGHDGITSPPETYDVWMPRPDGAYGVVMTMKADRLIGPVTEPDSLQIEAVPAALRVALTAARTDATEHALAVTNVRDELQSELASFKTRVRREALRVRREQGWCEAGTNESLRILGLDEIVEGFHATVSLTRRVRVKVTGTSNQHQAMNWACRGLRITTVTTTDTDVEILDDSFGTEVDCDQDDFVPCDGDYAASLD